MDDSTLYAEKSANKGIFKSKLAIFLIFAIAVMAVIYVQKKKAAPTDPSTGMNKEEMSAAAKARADQMMATGNTSEFEGALKGHALLE